MYQLSRRGGQQERRLLRTGIYKCNFVGALVKGVAVSDTQNSIHVTWHEAMMENPYDGSKPSKHNLILGRVSSAEDRKNMCCFEAPPTKANG